MRRAVLFAAALLAVLGMGLPARAQPSLDVYKAMGIVHTDVLSGSLLTSKVIPGDDKQVVALVTYFTGASREDDAVNVTLTVFRKDGESLVPIYTRDYGKENGGPVGRGELVLLDLDGDGANEIMVTFDSAKEKLVEERRGEVILHDDSGFRVAWSGAMEYDATKAVRDVPQERRDKFVRKFDSRNTLKTHGVTLFMTKKMIVVAGERLASPREMQETFPLRPEPK